MYKNSARKCRFPCCPQKKKEEKNISSRRRTSAEINPTQQLVMGTLRIDWKTKKTSVEIRNSSLLGIRFQVVAAVRVSSDDASVVAHHPNTRYTLKRFDGFVRQALSSRATSVLSRLRASLEPSAVRRFSLFFSKFLPNFPRSSLSTRVGIWPNLHLNRIIYPSTERASSSSLLSEPSSRRGTLESVWHSSPKSLVSFPQLQAIILRQSLCIEIQSNYMELPDTHTEVFWGRGRDSEDLAGQNTSGPKFGHRYKRFATNSRMSPEIGIVNEETGTFSIETTGDRLSHRTSRIIFRIPRRTHIGLG